MADTITLHDIQISPDKDFENIYNLENTEDSNENTISPYDICPTNCSYYEPAEFQITSNEFVNGLSLFHLNFAGYLCTLG
jgi:hypothetical protein